MKGEVMVKVNPFAFKQIIYVCNTRHVEGLVDASYLYTMEELPTALLDICAEHEAYNIIIGGPKLFTTKIKDKIEKNYVNYSFDKKINIELK